MQIERVYFQKNFQVGDFLYEHIGVGLILEAGESATEARETARQFTIDQHFLTHKEMYEQRGSKVVNVDSPDYVKKPMDFLVKSWWDKAVAENDTETMSKLEKEFIVC